MGELLKELDEDVAGAATAALEFGVPPLVEDSTGTGISGKTSGSCGKATEMVGSSCRLRLFPRRSAMMIA